MTDKPKILPFPKLRGDSVELSQAREMMEQFATRFADHCHRAGMPATRVLFEFDDQGDMEGHPRRAAATVNVDPYPEYELRFEVSWRRSGDRPAEAGEAARVLPLSDRPDSEL